MRGAAVVSEIDLYDFLLHGIRTPTQQLQDGDTILVPPAGPQITVEGSVKRPAIYELKGETKLSEVLDDAGGIQSAQRCATSVWNASPPTIIAKRSASAPLPTVCPRCITRSKPLR